MRSLRFAVITAVSLAAVAPAVAWQRLNKQDSDRFEAKMSRIVALGNQKQARPSGPVTTPISDAEINAYLEYGAKAQVPAGIVEPRLNALGEGRVGGQATVDLDAVRKQKQRGWLDPMSYLTGRLPVTAAGRLTTKDGIGQFQLDSAEISGVTVPKAVLQELLTHYSRTPENPAGIDMDAPFELPSRIREIRVGTGTSTIVQ